MFEIAFSDSGREEVAQIAEACLLAGRGDWIPELIRKGATLVDAQRLLAEAAAADVANLPRSAANSQAWPADPLAAAAAVRFAAQSRRYE